MEGRARLDPGHRARVDAPALPRATPPTAPPRRPQAARATPPRRAQIPHPRQRRRSARSCSCSSPCPSCPRSPVWRQLDPLRVPDEVHAATSSGQFLATRRGTVKLFTWQDPQSAYPADALRVRAADVRALVARAAAVDAPAAYRPLRSRQEHVALPVRVRSATGRQLELAPRHRLRPGRYVFVATHEGMFGGRDFAYLTVVRPGEPVTADQLIRERLRASNRGLAPPRCRCSRRLAVRVPPARSYWQRPAGQKALWAAGFALFAVASRVRGRRPASGVEPDALPFVLHRRRSAHRCVSRRGLRLAVASRRGPETSCSALSRSAVSRRPFPSGSPRSTSACSRPRPVGGRRTTARWSDMPSCGLSSSTRPEPRS